MKSLQIVFLSLLIFGCATTEKLRQTTQQIEIDGISDDWPNFGRFNKDLKIIYGATFDTNFLYVLVKANDEASKQNIISSGLTVWINPNGKKNNDFGVRYPILNGAKGNKKPNKKKNVLNEDNISNVSLKGFISSETQIVRKEDLRIDLDVTVKLDTFTALIYELRIPIEVLKQHANKELKQIAIGFEIKAMARPRVKNNPTDEERTGGGRAGGGGRTGGGGRSGGGGRGGERPSFSQNTPSDEPSLFWYKVEL